MRKFGLIVAGFGGQGVLFVGQLLAHAAVIEGKQVAWIPSYGPEMRGGTAHCMVAIAEREISSPLVEEPDAVMVFNRPSLDKFEPIIIKGGLLLVNSSMVDRPPVRRDLQVYPIAANTLAEQLGNSRVANMIMLGALVKLTGIVSIDSVLQALQQVLPEHRRDLLTLNQKALELGAASFKVA
ncbi:pyruvate/ketoisovalerate oxidoreductase subunit gamma [Calderihabitans maritimus]|uniref:Pyruvate/ketoisovalerate oxidoreductase subunit gamma n=2 Tax=Calderihabitans maritimus TaxID=1246530 RepID=A0A1Z5HSF6_9FIRM|nr:pyruvate/ketoisovalerate oxidoreductase subunit gamma [Calderihabitans maritimus]